MLVESRFSLDVNIQTFIRTLMSDCTIFLSVGQLTMFSIRHYQLTTQVFALGLEFGFYMLNLYKVLSLFYIPKKTGN